MKLLKQVAIIFSICWVSEIVEQLLPFSFPASVIGMILLFVFLLSGGLKIAHIQEKSDFLLSNMAFFFIPAGVSVMNYFDVLKSSALPLLLVCVLTTVITFAATAGGVKLTLCLMQQKRKKK
ncbi:MAG: CidA/LrgA family protein [bacterium]|nr:CidA/LrgA family protein [bacterium]